MKNRVQSCWLGRLPICLATCLLVVACSQKPLVPDWQGESKDALDRANTAYLEGDTRVALAEMQRVRSSLGATGRADWLATAELAHCAARTASLVFEDCQAFEDLRPEATPAQIAYADYLRGRASASDRTLLPAAQQGVAGSTGGNVGPLKDIADPLSRLVGAAVLLQQGQASPAVIALATDTASEQGWRRPLLAWLGVQALRAEQAGNTAEVQRLRRRMALAEGRIRATP